MIVIATCFMCFPIVAHWIKRRPDLRLVRVPMGDRAPEGLKRLATRPELLMSVGFSGGLTVHERLGRVVLASSVEHAGERILIDEQLLGQAKRALDRQGMQFSVGHTLCSPRIASTAREKAELAKTGAIAVDMESGALYRWARSHHVEFLSLRVILDPVDKPLPFSEAVPTWQTILKHPGQTLWTARAARVAGRSLGSAVNGLVGTWGTMS